MKFNKEETLELLWILYKNLGRRLTKSDVDNHQEIPSYNTICRHGIKLCDVNASYAEKLYLERPATCKLCSSKLPFLSSTNKFCSSSCAATFNNRNRGKVHANQSTSKELKPVISCLSCSRTLPSCRPSVTKYCSRACMASHKYELRFRSWYECGQSFSNKVLRSFLETCRGYSCEVCGLSRWNGKDIVLEVEHINGNSDDSSKENICLICPNCHSQTPTYKGRNTGNGRHLRMLRYKSGKSY